MSPPIKPPMLRPLTLRDAEPICRWPLEAMRRGYTTEAEARERIERVLLKCSPRTARKLRAEYLP